MIKTAEINQRLLEDLPVLRLPKVVPPGGGLSIWWMGDDRIAFQAASADTNGAYAGGDIGRRPRALRLATRPELRGFLSSGKLGRFAPSRGKEGHPELCGSPAVSPSRSAGNAP